ncbi:unnamed protein product [Pseudo-nitzschia multistriata]|uniref:Uncharacterized protein n=1 Tax=Pseudo-nitzschia multistriata TaxID=183589 RepID=A0A448Z171_9STRA|nr:unnamed protein product [Pseudo-nitzschia multistriata]
MAPDSSSTGGLETSLLAESIAVCGGESNDGSNRGNADGSSSEIPQGCRFSPDGTCLLTARGSRLEIYNTPYEGEVCTEGDGDKNDDGNEKRPRWTPAITCHSGESVRSYAWYPHMKSSDPATCCFLGASRDSPVHLYDAYDGSIRATYRPYNGLDEMESPTTLCFAESGRKIVTGGLRTDRVLHVFDVNRPGREHSQPLIRLGKTRRSRDGQKGLGSAMAYSDATGVLALGTYSPGSIYLYDLRTYTKSAVAEIVVSPSATSGGTVCVSGHGKKGTTRNKNKRKRFAAPASEGVEEALPSIDFSAAKLRWYQSRTRGGVTQVEFGDGGTSLFSASRRSGAVLQWDLRKLSSSNACPGIASFATDNDTNQRIEFAVYGDRVWTGGRDGCVRVYSHRGSNGNSSSSSNSSNNSSNNNVSLLATIGGFKDCVNGISLCPDVDGHVDGSTGTNTMLQNLLSTGDSDDDEPKSNETGGLGKALLAVAIGSRHFPSETDWENEDPHASLTERINHFVGSTQIYSVVAP